MGERRARALLSFVLQAGSRYTSIQLLARKMFPHHLHGQVWQVAKARPLGVPVLAGGATCLPALLGTPRSSKGHLRGTASGVCQPWVLGRVGKRPEEQPRDLAPWPAVSAESLRHCTKALQSWPVALWGRRAGNCACYREGSTASQEAVAMEPGDPRGRGRFVPLLPPLADT